MRKRILSLCMLFTLLITLAFPSLTLAIEEPNIIGTSAIIMDLDTKEIIYAKNMDELKQPASITKLMTALLLAENKTKTDIFTYSEAASKQDPYSYGMNVHPVAVGDTFNGENAMNILLLFSGNDIAYMIAENIGGTVENFMNMMNEKAKSLGMNNTHFVTPNGLDDNTDEHYTTAYDLALLLSAAYQNDWVRETMAKKTEVVQSQGGPVATIENRNKLVGTNGNVGGKTGYTDKSGRCLASLYSRNGRNFAIVVLNSEYDFPTDVKVFEDTEILADFGYAAQKGTYLAANSTIDEVTVEYNILPFIGPKKTVKIPVTLHEDINLYESGLKPEFNYTVNPLNTWTLSTGKPIGKATVTIKDYTLEYDLYSTLSNMDIIKTNIIYYVMALLVLIAVVCLIFIIISKIMKSKRRKRRYY
ncbi:MAG: D-alanyl-D-alanine carboxypeptidase family protein [Clostridium sp.]|uniref:D-alanyl-D-alanine carboxypeptidase family protein n=1 Tax=Clostridium culturomicium TaxID=1499683 RepID=UPI0006947860|nr:D-alanyl-D-alanine carboxypeptidase family protein [Clostridium culturomicium]MDU4891316.1 D-alanyl-D-alanine carboxypeptidase family protein [Clostridium sp.]MDU7085124.1 D-alanyl-D-alanine carboxypeptidase family protein [Clostridium sp.]